VNKPFTEVVRREKKKTGVAKGEVFQLMVEITFKRGRKIFKLQLGLVQE